MMITSVRVATINYGLMTLDMMQCSLQTTLYGRDRTVHPLASAVSLTTLHGSQRTLPIIPLTILSCVCALLTIFQQKTQL